MYKITISELVLLKVQQKNRVITRKQFIKIKQIDNIRYNDLSQKVIELKKAYKDFKYIIDFEKQ